MNIVVKHLDTSLNTVYLVFFSNGHLHFVNNEPKFLRGRHSERYETSSKDRLQNFINLKYDIRYKTRLLVNVSTQVGILSLL